MAGASRPANRRRPAATFARRGIPALAFGVLAATLGVHGSSRPAVAAGDPGFSKIKHVVVIDQENRSFDHVFGQWCQARTPKCNGYFGPVHLRNGTTVPMTQAPDVVAPDAPHDTGSQASLIDGGKMDGWNMPYCKPVGVPTNICLTGYAPSQVPAITRLASQYALSDRTFSLEAGPSFGGHMAPVAAAQEHFTGDNPVPAPGVTPGPGWGCDSKQVARWLNPTTGRILMEPSCIPAPAGVLDAAKYPYGGAFAATKVASIPTIMDRLQAAKLSWKFYSTVYQWSICPSFAKCLYTGQRTHVVNTMQVLTDGANGTLPAFSIVLPSGPGSTGQHPPASMLDGDNWIGQVVDSIMNGPQAKSTAIFITYDDCGCFYDHVPPGVNPDGTPQGPRVPMVIVSPYARHGFVDSKPATVASVLRFTERAFGFTPLGVNDAQAYDFGDSFDFTQVPGAARFRFRPAPLPQSTVDFFRTHPGAIADSEDDGT